MSARRHSRLGPRSIPYGRLVIALQAILALAFLVYLLRGDHVTVPLIDSTYELQAAFDDAAGLDGTNSNPVTIAGVRVGKVIGMRYEDGRAVATLRLDSAVRERIRGDARARIRPRSALQDNVVEIAPGSKGPALEPGERISAGTEASPVALDRVLETLDADSRAHLQILLGELRVALEGRATPLREALGRLDDVAGSTDRVAAALADRRRLLARLVGELDTVFSTLGRRGDALGTVIASGRRTLETTAARDAELASTIRTLPGTLDALSTALADVRTLSGPLSPALSELRPAARSLPGALAALRRFVPAGQGLVRDLRPLVRDGRAPAASLAQALRALGPTADGLREPVAGLRPIVGEIDRNKDGIGKLGERFSGVFSTNDANGTILRGLGFFEPFNPANVGAPGASGAELRSLKLKSVRALVKACRSNGAACLARHLVPGLPGATRSAEDPLGRLPVRRKGSKP